MVLITSVRRIPYLSFMTTTSPLAIKRLLARISSVSPAGFPKMLIHDLPQFQQVMDQHLGPTEFHGDFKRDIQDEIQFRRLAVIVLPLDR